MWCFIVDEGTRAYAFPFAGQVCLFGKQPVGRVEQQSDMTFPLLL